MNQVLNKKEKDYFTEVNLMRKRREGFTLVELLIVMAVIAALMGALVPVAINAINHAKATRVAENLRSILSTAQQYVYSEHKIPAISTIQNQLTGTWNTSDYAIYYSEGSKGTDPSSSDYTPADSPQSWPTNESSITLAVVYKGGIPAKDIYNVWSEATTAHSPLSTAVAVRTSIVKYW